MGQILLRLGVHPEPGGHQGKSIRLQNCWIKLSEMMRVGHPAQHPAHSRCLIVVFEHPESAQTLLTNADAWDGDGVMGLGTTVLPGRQRVRPRSSENLTVIKAAAAAGPAVNAYFALHFVQIRRE